MTKTKWIIAGLVIAFAGAGVAGLPGVGFFAPSVDGKDNVYGPETGAIVYDSSDESFYGRTHTGSWVALEDGETGATALIKDVKTSGTNGGTFPSGSFQTRVLNTLEGDTSFISLASNQFTLSPGKYLIEAKAPGYRVNEHKVRLQDVTNSVTIANGSSEVAADHGHVLSWSQVVAVVVVATSTAYEIQHRAGVTYSTGGYGVASNFGVDEVYTQVKITKLN